MNNLFIIYILWFLSSPLCSDHFYSTENNNSENHKHEVGNSDTCLKLKLNELISEEKISQNNSDKLSLIEVASSAGSILNYLPYFGKDINNIDKGISADRSSEYALISFSGYQLDNSFSKVYVQQEDTILFLNEIQATAFIQPESGDTIVFGSVLAPVVSFSNNGMDSQSNVPVWYLIIDSAGNEIYNQPSLISAIDSGEIQNVTFPASSSLTSSGRFTIISYSELAEDQVTSNDTINGSIFVAPLLNDIEATSFVLPLSGDTLDVGSVITPQVTFINNGSVQLANVPVRYSISDSSGNEIYNQSFIIQNIDSGEILNVTFPVSDSLSIPGTYSIKAISELQGDQITSNDTLIGLITVSPFQGDPAFTVNWIERPVNFQLFARESDDSGRVIVQGVINNSGAYYDTCLTKLYRNGTLIMTTYQLLSYAGDNAFFSITDKIKAERSEYKITFSLRKPSGAGDSILYTADSLVAGDTYLINGQSNVFFAPQDGGLLNFTNEYIRTFGIQTDSLNDKAYNVKDTTWGKSDSYFRITTFSEGHPRNVGGIGQFLQKYILDTFNIPTCIINGSINNTSIKTHLRNNFNSEALNTLYGKLLYRTRKSKLENKIKAIIWFQGESDNSYSSSVPSLYNPRGTADPYSYPLYFDSLYNQWVEDYDFKRIYVFQIRQVACTYQNRQSMFREVQRQLQNTYHDTVQVIPTVGIGNRETDYCHYKASGYDQLAHNLFRRLRQEFYSISDSVDMRPPNIVKAFYASFDNKKIGMIFGGSKPGTIPVDSLSRNIKNYFYLNDERTSNAVSLTLSLLKDTLILTMPESQSASYINYLPNQDSLSIYNGPFIRNSKGIGMLTFDSVFIHPFDGLPQNDIQPTGFIYPLSGDTLAFGSVFTPQVKFTNNGSDHQTNVSVYFRISDTTGNEIYIDSSLIVSLESAETLTVSFRESSASAIAGNYTISTYSNLAGDQVTANDTLAGSIVAAPLMNDIQPTGFISPLSGDTLAFGSVFTPQVSFTNNGLNTQTNVSVYFRITDTTGNDIYTDSALVVSIEAAETLTVAFRESQDLTTAGNYTISSYSNLAGDQVTGNDTIFGSLTMNVQMLKFIELRFGLEGMFPVLDTVRVFLANSFPPFQIIDSSTVFTQIENTDYIVYPSFANFESENSCYILVKHRNSIVTWSSVPVVFNTDTISYNFTSSLNMAYSNNMKLVGNIYCIYSGDENQDGVSELSDVVDVFNAAGSFISGYFPADMNGDNIVDLSDLVITFNNASEFVSVFSP